PSRAAVRGLICQRIADWVEHPGSGRHRRNRFVSHRGRTAVVDACGDSREVGGGALRHEIEYAGVPCRTSAARLQRVPPVDSAELHAKAIIAAALITAHAVEVPTIPRNFGNWTTSDPAAIRLRDLTEYVLQALTAPKE